MSTIVHPSSSLLALNQNNDSQSTVSSDTDVDSIAYHSSSSGTTTPEDEDQTFHLGVLGSLDHKPGIPRSKAGFRGKLTLETRPRSFSATMKKIKKVALALAVFKRKLPDDISPILISSPLRERFGKRMSVKSHPDENFYSLPNRRFSLQDVSTLSEKEKRPSGTITRKFGTISESSSAFVKSTLRRKQSSGFRIPSFADSFRVAPTSPASSSTVVRNVKVVFTLDKLLAHALRVLFFVPWCAAVGGALLLFPSYLEPVTFRTGYLPSSKGLRRFAYWAECARQHVMIFLAFLVLVLWYRPAMGVSLISIVVSRFVLVWRSFKVDRGVPLGEDDQQSLYIVVTDLMFADSGSFVIRGASGAKVAVTPDNLEQSTEDVVGTDTA